MNPTSSRRNFLKTAGAAAAGISTLNLITTAKGAAGSLVVGEGAFKYECLHNWARLAEGHFYGNASHGTAFDSQGLIYIAHQGGPGSVFVFDPDGKFVKSLVPEHEGQGHGISIQKEADGQEYMYLSPSSADMAFTKATLGGKIVWTRGKKDLEKASGLTLAKYRPTNASFAPDGSVFLGDGYGSGYIFHYSAKGDFLGVFGGDGTENGKFKTPHGQWLDARDGTPKTVVCDRANKRLQWFDMEGKHLKTLDGFLFPADADIQGDIMVVPDLHARITLLDKENKVVAQLGDDESWRAQVLDSKNKMRVNPALWQPGKFVHPHDAAFDKAGNIYVAEWVSGGRVTKLKKVS